VSATAPTSKGGAQATTDGASAHASNGAHATTTDGARARVFETPLVVDDVIRAVTHTGAGAVVVMIGCVRDHTTHDAQRVTVDRLEYEAYAPMAEKIMSGIVDEAQARWAGTRACVHHRVGALALGDLAVVVAVSAPHRGDAFAACQHVIDRLKQDAPIWKREHGADGVTWVGLGP
jgi:molybdopterin synthase catalytic subunit